uniref:CSON002399 protein n=1 Tax=Culicoides sonorensis TaxID=179676 RepID=A0A336LHY7_CULSO
MLGSRGVVLSRLVRQLANKRLISTSQVKKSGHVWVYRKAAAPGPKWISGMAYGTGALMWWWILWHLWHEPEHVYGEFPYPDPSQWTNAELGIPPDDEGLAERLVE